MLAELILRRRTRAVDAARRTEVCPPALLPPGLRATANWRTGLRQWLASGWQFAAPGGGNAVADATGRVRAEFLDALHDVRTQQAGMLLARIRCAHSLRDLWHLRPEVFNLVAQRYDQSEAQLRLDRLNRHFPTRSPRSGFAPLADGTAPGARRTPD